MIANALLLASALLFAAVVAQLVLAAIRAHQQKPLASAARESLSDLLGRLARRTGPRIPLPLHRTLATTISQAGTPMVTPERLVARAILLMLFGSVWAVALLFGGVPWYVAASAPLLGAAFPFLQLRDRQKARQQAILRDLSYHLDLLTLSVEAGLDFGAAIGRIVEKGRAGPLRDELAIMLSEIRIGTARSVALKAMSERVALPQLSSLTSALIQADKIGVSLGKVLRTQSETVRTERSQRAEKRANEAPVKILIPLVLFVFPTIWIILAAPLLFSWLYSR